MKLSKAHLSLSAAIRLGSMLRPQAFGHYFIDGGSCAMGAALNAVGGRICDEYILWPMLRDLNGRHCPECSNVGREGGQMLIAHLSDTHRWTREAIADFVEQIENQQESTVSEPEPVEASK